jgi:hypothetical protein
MDNGIPNFFIGEGKKNYTGKYTFVLALNLRP